MAAGVGVGRGGEALATFGHDKTQRFDEVRVCIEHSFHRGVTDLKDLSLFERKHVRSSWLTRKQRHLTEKVAFIQGRDRSCPAVVVDLNPNPAFVNDEHR